LKENEDITDKLKNLVKKKNIQIVVIKAGSIKNSSKSSTSGIGEEYYPSYNE